VAYVPVAPRVEYRRFAPPPPHGYYNGGHDRGYDHRYEHRYDHRDDRGRW
jgi:hypothetical protein